MYLGIEVADCPSFPLPDGPANVQPQRAGFREAFRGVKPHLPVPRITKASWLMLSSVLVKDITYRPTDDLQW